MVSGRLQLRVRPGHSGLQPVDAGTAARCSGSVRCDPKTGLLARCATVLSREHGSPPQERREDGARAGAPTTRCQPTGHRDPARSEVADAPHGGGSGVVKRSDVTYGQLDKVLRSLRFTCRLDSKEPPARIYEHKQSGAMFMFPVFPETDKVFEHHMIEVRFMLDQFGIADPKALA